MGATTVSGTILGVDNAPRVGVYVYFRLKTTGTDSVATSTIDATRIASPATDANGQFSVTLWDNGDSGVTSIMEIQMPSGQRHDVIIPASDAAIDVWDLIENYTVGTADPQLPTNQALFMRKADNLSDVADVPTSRTNLGLGTAAITAATDYATAAQGTLADSALQPTDIGLTVQAYSVVLDGTTAAFTTADETKLDGIEALADVTDATNIVAAGGYISGGTDVTILDGGTGASDVATARTNFGFQTNVTGGVTAVGVTNYTVLTTDHTLTVDDTAIGGNVTINLPAVATVGSGFMLNVAKKGTSFNVTVDGNGSETINGALNYVMSNLDATVTIVSTATKWEIISEFRGSSSDTTSVTTTTYTTLVTDSVLLVNDDTAGAAVTITLISAVTAGDGFSLTIKKLGSTADVIIDADGTETIDDSLTNTIKLHHDFRKLVSDGANWKVIG